ncbi:MAG TPA: IS5 family transposase [Nitrososphaeraceae archaeon]
MNKQQSKYVRLADQLLRILKHCRLPLYLHRKSNHIYTVWQHIVLVTIRQYEGKSYRMFTDWLVEAYYLRLFLQLSKIPHYTTLQKFTDRINVVMLGKIISSFILFTDTRHIFAGIDSTGFKITNASEYYTSRAKLRKKYAKLSIGADVLQQIVCSIKIRRAPTRHDNIDFKPIVTRISKIKSLSVVVADKAYDSEDNHVLVIEKLHGLSIMPARYEGVPVWKTHGRYRKGMKRGYNKILYNQRNKDETIVSVIKRLFGEHITSRLIRMQNRELTLRCIAYNVHRMVKLVVMVMVSTQPVKQVIILYLMELKDGLL